MQFVRGPSSEPGRVAGVMGTAAIVAGTALDSNSRRGVDVIRSFLRGHSGTVASFDAPRSTITASSITGYYMDAGNVAHGFLRDC